MTLDRAAHHRRLVRPWRIAFVLYLMVLTVLTHWPNLQLGEPSEGPATDKPLHLLTFGGLAWLFWRTRWLPHRWLAIGLVLVWCVVDEVTQGIPILERRMTWSDLIASMAGVVIVAAWLWAMRPIGLVPNQMRQRLLERAFDITFTRPATWIRLVSIGLVFAVLIVVGWILLPHLTALRLAVVCLTSGAILGIALVFFTWRAELRQIVQQRCCFQCGSSCTAAPLDQHGAGECPKCRAPIQGGQWSDPRPPSSSIMLRSFMRPLLLTAVIIAVGFGLIVLSNHVYSLALQSRATSAPATRIARLIGTLPRSMIDVIDVTLLLVLLAGATRVHRSQLARHYDQAERCRVCDHDLRGTPLTQGIGRCGECGTEFVRLIPANR